MTGGRTKNNINGREDGRNKNRTITIKQDTHGRRMEKNKELIRNNNRRE